MSKPVLLWVDQTVATTESELPAQCARLFDVRACMNNEAPEECISELEPAGVCFDFDYPDRRRLTQFVNLKQRYSHVPMFIMTVQHSEAMATWSYRNAALDYLVKPIPENDLRRCLERILEIEKLKRGQDRRRLPTARAPMPTDVPAGSRSITSKLAPAIYYVQQYYDQRIYSNVVARQCEMSSSHFSRAFRQTFDITFQDYLLRYRIGEACRQLRSPDVSITDVAYAVGFTDASYFTKIFTRYVGVSPSAYCKAADVTDNEVLLQEIAATLGQRPARQVPAAQPVA
ncbi:MAG: helix-turn-helix domain-containing protein [Gammaproteobacteria bacterium]